MTLPDAPQHPAPRPSVPRLNRRFRRARGVFVVSTGLLSLTGCYSVRVRDVGRTVIVAHVLDATLEQLVARTAANYTQVQTISASVEITASTGGEHQGQIKEIPAFAGYIFLRKPADLHVLLLVPVLRSRALEMTSNGTDFKLLIPSKNRAIVGSETMSTPSKNGLENLRPNIIRDSLLVPPVGPGEFVTLTESARITPSPTNKREKIEEPDYDLTVLRAKPGAADHVLERVRVVHFGRITLEPYRQDVYDRQGRIETVVEYDKWTKNGDVDYPGSILITRPLDEYKLKIDFTKVQFNGKLDDEQFVLKLPDGVPVTKM